MIFERQSVCSEFDNAKLIHGQHPIRLLIVSIWIKSFVVVCKRFFCYICESKTLDVGHWILDSRLKSVDYRPLTIDSNENLFRM